MNFRIGMRSQSCAWMQSHLFDPGTVHSRARHRLESNGTIAAYGCNDWVKGVECNAWTVDLPTALNLCSRNSAEKYCGFVKFRQAAGTEITW
jgi:hypothetical protein